MIKKEGREWRRCLKWSSLFLFLMEGTVSRRRGHWVAFSIKAIRHATVSPLGTIEHSQSPSCTLNQVSQNIWCNKAQVLVFITFARGLHWAAEFAKPVFSIMLFSPHIMQCWCYFFFFWEKKMGFNNKTRMQADLKAKIPVLVKQKQSHPTVKSCPKLPPPPTLWPQLPQEATLLGLWAFPLQRGSITALNSNLCYFLSIWYLQMSSRSCLWSTITLSA